MRVMVLSSHTSSLFWFRMDMMKAFIDKGYDVIAVGSESAKEWGERFSCNGIRYKQIPVERNGINPLKDFKTFGAIRRLISEEMPDKIFVYQAKTIVYGTVAARISGCKNIYPLIAGLGSIFRGHGLKNRIIRAILTIQYSIACRLSENVFFQNNDDRSECTKRGIVPISKTKIINGSGVNLSIFTESPMPEQFSFLYIGRLLRDKGVGEYLEACMQIKKEYKDVRCMLVGPYDTNHSSLTEAELEPYIKNGIVEYFGEQRDVKPFIDECSVYVLPSYHEGTPKTVLEAMAVGRPIITTDAPGCRETVVDGHNGFLVEVKDVDSIVEKMRTLIEDHKQRQTMAKRSREIAEQKYDVNLVNHEIMTTMGII